MKTGLLAVVHQGGVWIDLVRDGKSLTSIAHMEGAPCSGIGKLVDFAMPPGAYTPQLSGEEMSRMRVPIATK
jgi:hypothetical protein